MKIVGWSLGYMNPGNLKPRNQKLILLAHRRGVDGIDLNDMTDTSVRYHACT